MTIKELFKKVETYNEIAELMNTRKASISFYDYGVFHGESFETFNEFRKWLRGTYIKEMADVILKLSDWEFDKKVTIKHTDYFGTSIEEFSADLVSAF